jgi:hypothetical protein
MLKEIRLVGIVDQIEQSDEEHWITPLFMQELRDYWNPKSAVTWGGSIFATAPIRSLWPLLRFAPPS